ncbi:MAG: GreA/GreB family elongation factor [Patescibacteria group bacterium]|nr:GreA/GreB family elongation factor [Patescibacteria group bacterium]
MRKTIMENVYLTEERYNAIVEELKELKTNGRKQIADRLKHAKDFGDLSENFDYQETKEDKSRLEQKIVELEEILRRSSIIKKSDSSLVVRVGSKVKVKKNKEILSYSIVGSNEAKPGEGLISNESPLGSLLLKRKVGEVVKLNISKGGVIYEILSID